MTGAAEVEVAGIPWIEVFALAAAITAVALVGTARWWLAAALGWLDRALTRMGVGTWSAKFLTWAEEKAARLFDQGARSEGAPPDEEAKR